MGSESNKSLCSFMACLAYDVLVAGLRVAGSLA